MARKGRMKPAKRWELGNPGAEALEERIVEAGPFPDNGGIIEYSIHDGSGAAWGRSPLRRGLPLTPATQEGDWFVMSALAGIGEGSMGYGGRNSKVAKLARELVDAINKLHPDLYDS